MAVQAPQLPRPTIVTIEVRIPQNMMITPTEKENDNGWNKENWVELTVHYNDEIDKTR